MDMNQITKQMQAIQQKLQALQEELRHTPIQGESGAGLVKVEIYALGHDVKHIDIDDSLMKENNKQVIEDLTAAAFNNALRKADKVTKEKMAGLPFDVNTITGAGGSSSAGD